nr:heat shock cognate 70 kDa protein-like [Tanacetum cinerariifolium]
AKFEELNATYFDKCIQLLESCLFDGEMKKKDVDEVVVVGGSSRILKIKRMVEEFFDGKTLCRSLNGNEAVASGAAILAVRSLNGNEVVASGAAILAVSFILNGLTLGINGMSRIEVCFNLNVDGILLVSAEEISTG